MTVTELAIKRPILIIVAFLAIALMGIFCYVNLKYELFPSLAIPSVMIATAYPGASARVDYENESVGACWVGLVSLWFGVADFDWLLKAI